MVIALGNYLQINHMCPLLSFLEGTGQAWGTAGGLMEPLTLTRRWDDVEWLGDMMWAFSSSESCSNCTFSSGSAPPKVKEHCIQNQVAL